MASGDGIRLAVNCTAGQGVSRHSWSKQGVAVPLGPDFLNAGGCHPDLVPDWIDTPSDANSSCSRLFSRTSPRGRRAMLPCHRSRAAGVKLDDASTSTDG